MEIKTALTKNTSNNIRSISFIMSCIIVAYHCFSDGNYLNALDQSINNFLYIFTNELATIAMYYFFFTSGFLLFINLNKDTVLTKIKKRCTSLLMPYVFWQILIYLSKIFILKQSISISELIETSFLFKTWPPNGPLWYVYIIFLLALLSPIFLAIFKNRNITIIIIPLFSLLSYQAYNNLPDIYLFFENSYLTNMFHYFTSYLIGSYIGYLKTNNKENREIFVVIIITLILSFVQGTTIFKEYLYSLIPIIIVLILNIEINISKKLCGLSFLIYALHPIIKTMFLNITTSTLSDLLLPYTLVNLISISTIIIICLIMAYLIKKIVNLICPKAITLITGGR